MHYNPSPSSHISSIRYNSMSTTSTNDIESQVTCLIMHADFQCQYRLSREDAREILHQNGNDLTKATVALEYLYNAKKYPSDGDYHENNVHARKEEMMMMSMPPRMKRSLSNESEGHGSANTSKNYNKSPNTESAKKKKKEARRLMEYEYESLSQKNNGHHQTNTNIDTNGDYIKRERVIIQPPKQNKTKEETDSDVEVMELVSSSSTTAEMEEGEMIVSNNEDEDYQKMEAEVEEDREENAKKILLEIIQAKLESTVHKSEKEWIKKIAELLNMDIKHELSELIDTSCEFLVKYLATIQNIEEEPFFTMNDGILLIYSIMKSAPRFGSGENFIGIPKDPTEAKYQDLHRKAEESIQKLQSSSYAKEESKSEQPLQEKKYLPSASDVIVAFSRFLYGLSERSDWFKEAEKYLCDNENNVLNQLESTKEGIKERMQYCENCLEETKQRRQTCVSARKTASTTIQHYTNQRMEELRNAIQDDEAFTQAIIDVTTSHDPRLQNAVCILNSTKDELYHLQNNKVVYDNLSSYFEKANNLFAYIKHKREISLVEAKRNFNISKDEHLENILSTVNRIAPYLTHAIFVQVEFEKQRYGYANEKLETYAQDLKTTQELFGDRASMSINDTKLRIGEMKRLIKEIDHSVIKMSEKQATLFCRCKKSMEAEAVKILEVQYRELYGSLKNIDMALFEKFSRKVLGTKEQKYNSRTRESSNQNNQVEVCMEKIRQHKRKELFATTDSEDSVNGTCDISKDSSTIKVQNIVNASENIVAPALQNDSEMPLTDMSSENHAAPDNQEESIMEDDNQLSQNKDNSDTTNEKTRSKKTDGERRFKVGDVIYTRFRFGDEVGEVCQGEVQSILPNYKYSVLYEGDNVYTVDESNCYSKEEISLDNQEVTPATNCIMM